MTNKKMEKFLLSPFLYAGIVALAAFLAAWGSYRIGKIRNDIANRTATLVESADKSLTELRKVGNSLNISLERIEHANLKLEENKKSIFETYEKTIESQKAIIQSKDEILGMITGGDSYPKIALFKDNIYVFVNGTYGIPDLKIEIYHLKNIDKIQASDISRYLSNGTESDNISKVYSGETKNLGAGLAHPIDCGYIKNELMKIVPQGFDIIFVGGFKKWIQRIRLYPINGKWERLDGLEETRTFIKTNNLTDMKSTIYFKASENFPHLFKVENEVFCGTNSYYVFDRKVQLIVVPNILHKITHENTIPPFDIDFFSK